MLSIRYVTHSASLEDKLDGPHETEAVAKPKHKKSKNGRRPKPPRVRPPRFGHLGGFPSYLCFFSFFIWLDRRAGGILTFFSFLKRGKTRDQDKKRPCSNLRENGEDEVKRIRVYVVEGNNLLSKRKWI